VSGVGPKLLDDVRPWVTFSGILPPRLDRPVSGNTLDASIPTSCVRRPLRPPGQTGHILVREGLITLEQLKKALQEQRVRDAPGYTLVKLGFIEEPRSPRCWPAVPDAGGGPVAL